MANSLLDFVMSLVRDPEAAARYAADPAQAIADAHLTGVTAADVNHLIPVVSESLPMGGLGGTEPADVNVWASGAATAAFDAFADPRAAVAPDQHQPVVVEPSAAPPADTAGLAADPFFQDVLEMPDLGEGARDVSIDDVAPADAATFDHPQFDDQWHTSHTDDGGFLQ